MLAHRLDLILVLLLAVVNFIDYTESYNEKSYTF
jgi:hypothetical protein